MPATVNSGDLLLMFAAMAFTDAMNTPTGWTAVFNQINSNTHALFAKVADGTEGGGTVTVSKTGGLNRSPVFMVHRVTGSFSGTLSDIEADTATGASANPDGPSFSPSYGGGDHLWFSSYGTDLGTTVSAYPTNYDNTQADVNTTDCNGGVASRQLSSATDDPGAFTITGGGAGSEWVCATVAVRGTVAGGHGGGKGKGPGGGGGNDPGKPGKKGNPPGQRAANIVANSWRWRR